VDLAALTTNWTLTSLQFNNPNKIIDMQTQDVLIKRTFKAPRQLVFNAWTDVAQLEKWYAPQGCTIKFSYLDAKPGGRFLSCVRTPDGKDCWCMGEYMAIDIPEKIIHTMVIADSNGNRVDAQTAGMTHDWPQETTVTLTFEETNGQTTVTLHQTVSLELAQNTGAYPSWLSMMDNLDAELEKQLTTTI
jgi:uncharacterized protein YndB with AHSA1/START domain